MISYTYKAIVTNIVDGDTVDATLDLGFHVYTKMRFRLNGIDTPEMNSKDEAIRALAKDAKGFLTDNLLNKEVIIIQYKTDKYGRWLADILESSNSPTINEQLVQLGLAKRYFGDQKTSLWS